MDRRNLIYTLILGVMVVAVVVVGVLVLRKRAALPTIVPIQSSSSLTSKTQQAPDTKPLNSYVKAAAWKQGDPVPDTTGVPSFGAPPSR